MSFADGAFPLFFLLVWALYAWVSSPPRSRRWRLPSLALVALVVDLVWLLALRPRTPPSTPWGFALAAWAAPRATSWARLALGLGCTLAGAIMGHHVTLSDTDAAQRRRGVAAGVATLAALGAFGLAWRLDRLAPLSAALAWVGHPLWSLAWACTVALALRPGARRLAQQAALFLVSALFYHAWAAAMPGAYRYLLGLIVATVVLDYWLALWIDAREDPRARRALLVLSLVANLGILGFFKYADFFGGSAAAGMRILGLDVSWHMLALVLPAGISFHTFQSLSYTVDVAERGLRPTRSLLAFATFVLFFPQLVAGPIVRAEQFLPQIASPPPRDEARAVGGLLRIALGLTKKLWLADTLAVTLVDRVFAHPELFSSLEVLAAVWGYAFQIYLDFSAYSDIAVGAAAMLGFTLPENFSTPYLARDLSEFWRRWHISLSTWLRDYLYIPLGGSRGGDRATYRNLALTMLLGGLWHGASFTFVVWGLLHGGGLAVTRAVQRRWERLGPAARPARDLGALGLFALSASALLWSARAPLGSLSTRHGLDPGWVFLTLGWLSLAPAASALGAWANARRWSPLAALVTLHYVLFAWVFFRAGSFASARAVLARLGEASADCANVSAPFWVALGVAIMSHIVPDRWMTKLRDGFLSAPWWLRVLLLGALGVGLRWAARPSVVPFIYFQF